MQETLYTARVRLADHGSTLNVRSEPGTGGQRIGRLSDGAAVRVVQEMDNGWCRIAYGDSGVGYVDGGYLARTTDDSAQDGVQVGTEAAQEGTTTIMRADGVCVTLAGRWSVAED